MLEIQVYGRPYCAQCKTTTQHLDKVGLPYRYRDVTEDQSAHDIVTALGYRSLPVVTVGDLHWSGYRYGRIKRLAEIHATAPDLTALEPAAIAYLTTDRIADAADQIAEHQRSLTPEQRAAEAAEFELEKAAMLAAADKFQADRQAGTE